MKKIFLGVCGFILCVFGIVLVLVFWKDVVLLFRGVVGALLAITGLAMMAVSRD